jgi:hypothetical protein
MDNLSRKRQELAGKLVEREVMCCVSQLISALQGPVAEGHIEDLDQDDLMAVCLKDDWETPGTYFIEQDADLDQLEQIADHFGNWDEIINDLGYGIYVDTLDEQEQDHDEFPEWLKGQDDCHTKEESFTHALRRAVVELVDDWSWVGWNLDLDAETREAYEHWVVSGWLGDKLTAHGEMVGDVLGLNVWGRCTSGQSICIDYVIEQITAEVWPEEWAGKEKA